MTDSITLALTGASGAQYGLRLLQVLLGAGVEVHLLVSDAACEVIRLETPYTLPDDLEARKSWLLDQFGGEASQLHLYSRNDWTAKVASGSNAPRTMVVCPCSSGTLSAIATGASNNLVERAADVVLKERRQLIIVHREMPLSSIHLAHLQTLAAMGVTVMPASPGFYHQPKTIEDLVDFVVSRILDQLGIDNELVRRWGQ